MLLELPIPIVQHRDGEDHIDAFNDFLSIENPTQGIFCSAYVTQKGIRAISSGLLKVAHVSDLYVGVRNGVTSKQAILAAMDLGMTAHIVDTGTPKFIFHYKFYYLANENAARAIIGSANLTGAGLEDNVELSNRLNLDFELYGIDRVDAYLSTTMEWLRYTREENVYQVEDEAHLDRLVDNRILVDENHGKKRRREGVDKKATKLVWDVPVMRFETKKRAVVTPSPSEAMKMITDGEVLITHVGAGPRWKQANFPKGIITGYFGLDLFSGEKINLATITETGSIDEVVPTKLVSVVSSNNFRLEIPHAHGEFPKNGRPIAVYKKCADKEFRIKLYMPDDTGHTELNDHLMDKYKGPSNQLNRVVTDSKTLQTVLPNCPV